MLKYIKKQIKQIQMGGVEVLKRKIILFKNEIITLPFYIIGLVFIIIIRIISPLILIRVGRLNCARIGHFTANVEMYLCEQQAGINVPKQKYIDLFFLENKFICNQQLLIMWQRVLRIWPTWILRPLFTLNRIVPAGKLHEIGDNSQHDRDIFNLLDKFKPHLHFTIDEEIRGEKFLIELGIPSNTKFVCLNVRDSAYLSGSEWSYHNYRDCNIQNFVLVAEALAVQGYYVVRMGAKVHESIKSENPKVIDYATNGMRNDFADIFLGAKCFFCISTGTGWDAVPENFRRPVVFVNLVPLINMHTYSDKLLTITKRHVWQGSQIELSLKEIFFHGVGFSSYASEFDAKGINLIENTPEEILDVVMEMEKRLNGNWQTEREDKELQDSFWDIFPADVVNPYNDMPYHGEIRGRFGAAFLRKNKSWLK